MAKLLKEESIASQIHLIRGEKVLLDYDLANLYAVETKILKRAVKRNIKRFPTDFMFELTADEHSSLRCQIGTLKRGQHSKYLPYAFTEQGVAMLSGILNSERAIQVNIAIMRTFVRIRSLVEGNKELARKINELEKITQERFSKQDEKIKLVFDAIKHLIQKDDKPNQQIGFSVD